MKKWLKGIMITKVIKTHPCHLVSYSLLKLTDIPNEMSLEIMHKFYETRGGTSDLVNHYQKIVLRFNTCYNLKINRI